MSKENLEDGMFHWHHRTIEHIDSRHPEEEPYLTVHEFSFKGNEYEGFTFSQASPLSKQEAKWILKAFDYPPVIRVDDASIFQDGHGYIEYRKWEWLERKVKSKGDKE